MLLRPFKVKILYGLDYCSFNIHILSHAAECVRNWGPLWALSMCQFEHFNGVIGASFNGTQKVGTQIAKKIIVGQRVCSLGEVLCNASSAKSFIGRMLNNQRRYKKYIKLGNCTLLGPSKIYHLNHYEQERLKSLGFTSTKALAFRQCIVNGMFYNTKECDTKYKCNSVILMNGKFFRIFKILKVRSSLVNMLRH